MDFGVIAEVEWYNEIDKLTMTDYIVLYANSYSSAARQIEEYYKDTLISTKITLLEDSFIQIDKEVADRILTGDFDGRFDT